MLIDNMSGNYIAAVSSQQQDNTALVCWGVWNIKQMDRTPWKCLFMHKKEKAVIKVVKVEHTLNGRAVVEAKIILIMKAF